MTTATKPKRASPPPKIPMVRRERFMSEWKERKTLDGASEFVRIGGSWFSMPKEAEAVQLANFEIVRADRVLVGNDDLAWAWGYRSKRSAEDKIRRIRWHETVLRKTRPKQRILPRENPVGSGRWSDSKHAQPVMPVDYAMRLYQEDALETKVRSPHTPSTGGKPGTRNWSHRAKFDVEFDENLLSEHETETDRARRDYERYVTGNYTDNQDQEE